MHYLIFVPGADSTPPAKALTQAGLPDFVKGVESIPLATGPVETPGLLCAWRKPGKTEKMHHNATEQTWVPALPNGPDGQGKGRYWVGFWNASPPVPDDLKRTFQHYGPFVQLGDHQQWRIPVADELPRDFVRAEDGSWKEEVQAEYHDLWLECRDWLTRIDSGKIGVEYVNVLDFCERMLRQNYRLTAEVVSRLKLFNSNNVASIFGAVLNRTFGGDETP